MIGNRVISLTSRSQWEQDAVFILFNNFNKAPTLLHSNKGKNKEALPRCCILH